jgi:uncharacterized membrane protein YjfL (UPF0719 family)
MSDKIRDAAANALDAFHDYVHWALAAALIGAAAFIVVRTYMTP